MLDKQLTVKENLISRAAYYGLARKQANQRIRELSEIFSLEEIIDRRYCRLSGGQKRRVDIARALLNRPKLLFLDEPTTGLDPQTRLQVWKTIHKLRKETGLTVFLTTHYMEETAECDRVVILDKGKILADDVPNNLKKLYANNRLVWYTAKSDKTENLILCEGKDYEYINNAYKIKINDSSDGLRLINKFDIKDFEVIKGDMDDVFLNITGKRLGE